jgi:hypothetical protein
MNSTFTASIENGNLHIDNPAEYNRHINSLNGKRVNVTVEKQTRRRTLDQNAWYWGVVLKLISEHTGQDAQSLHEAFKYMFSDKITIKGLVIPKSSRTRDTIDFSEYCENIRQWARAFLGVEIPDPKPQSDAG